MKTRFFAALFTLLALAALTVQGVWASTCRAEMRGEMVASSADAPASAAICAAETVQLSSSSDNGGGSDDPHCPSMPFGMASSCSGAVALPVTAVADLASSPEGAVPFRSPNHLRDLVFASAFFRPPIV